MRRLILFLTLSASLLAFTANAEAGWGHKRFKVKKNHHKSEVKAGPFKYKKKY